MAQGGNNIQHVTDAPRTIHLQVDVTHDRVTMRVDDVMVGRNEIGFGWAGPSVACVTPRINKLSKRENEADDRQTFQVCNKPDPLSILEGENC